MATGAEPSDDIEGQEMRSKGQAGARPYWDLYCSYGKPFGFYPESLQKKLKDAEQRGNVLSHPFLTLTQCAVPTDGFVSPKAHLNLPKN